MKNWLQSLAALALSVLVGQAGAQSPSVPASAGQRATAIFAGGCFWCVEADFEKLPGVIAAESGYTGGKTANPTYQTVSAGGTGHTEAVRLTYDPGVVSYPVLLDFFWRHIDPTVKDRQFCDVGNQYRSAIYYNSPAQKALVEASKAAILKSGVLKEIHTEIAPESAFYLAEDYHQSYYTKNPLRYNYYRLTCGRDSRVAEVWGTKN
ncbi:peptide-methionine (S)-S-oxide reductase MsrA [Polaromonas sp. CG_9.11]|uniref:peptide-methionine (S)-S-oxide reductase MsrA n=1 Tax=Polaromonas sp. CG_9.11 TaxID=2787730 RepID=UPI0018CB06E0|nr:peptide-methionine (S)-S-oxide reductase MsrA [Polaromonas sp. CG_9.11]MBG6077899.1 peptide-methionine (S)-S-oxide reductase [Polaromonas sp. CG_9.11]